MMAKYDGKRVYDGQGVYDGQEVYCGLSTASEMYPIFIYVQL